MSRFSKHIILVAVGIALIACRKDVKPEPAGVTPDVFEYPDLFAQYLPAIDEPNDNLTSEEGVQLGRKLFFDVRLSEGETQS